MGAMLVGCYNQMSTIKEGVIKRLQCIYVDYYFVDDSQSLIKVFFCIFFHY